MERTDIMTLLRREKGRMTSVQAGTRCRWALWSIAEHYVTRMPSLTAISSSGLKDDCKHKKNIAWLQVCDSGNKLTYTTIGSRAGLLHFMAVKLESKTQISLSRQGGGRSTMSEESISPCHEPTFIDTRQRSSGHHHLAGELGLRQLLHDEDDKHKWMSTNMIHRAPLTANGHVKAFTLTQWTVPLGLQSTKTALCCQAVDATCNNHCVLWLISMSLPESPSIWVQLHVSLGCEGNTVMRWTLHDTLLHYYPCRRCEPILLPVLTVCVSVRNTLAANTLCTKNLQQGMG